MMLDQLPAADFERMMLDQLPAAAVAACMAALYGCIGSGWLSISRSLLIVVVVASAEQPQDNRGLSGMGAQLACKACAF